MYIDVVILLVFYLFTNNNIVLTKTEKIYLLLSVFFLLFILVLLQSKMGMFISAGLILVLLVRYAMVRGYKTAIGLLIIGLIVYFSTFHFLIGARSRMASATEIVMNKHMSSTSGESTQVRYYVWHAAIEVIKEYPIFGVGIGNESVILIDQYTKDNYTGAAKEKLNAHDQYIQTTVSTGIIGLFVLLAGFLLPFIKAVKERRFVYGAFLVVVAANFLVEAMFELQSGTIFFGLFNSLLMFNFVI
jgi:O-antigen ligase